MAPVRRLTSSVIRARKGKRFPVITAYDAPFARCVEDAGIDVILVGDSLGNVVLGLESTAPVELDDMCRHGAAVKRGTSRAHVIVDLPFGTYQASDEDAVRASIALVKAGASSVKLEGGIDAASRIAAIVRAGIPVVGHIGVMPQTAGNTSGFKRKADGELLLADARAAEAAGAFAVVLEMVDADVARQITAALAIPTIGIGAGPHCDAQVLVLHDALGLYAHAPPFAKRFAELAQIATGALQAYASEVRDGTFPAAPSAVAGDAPVYVVSTPS
ncbi:MAG: 3-methyl-2-oxobutanoate hydroxymethyltransferase [Candidatus Eremiobacteraeota bacterium]|nr:3-methyl-2-oxobutanoate hydroxymethyltransferase [Candidatus Eremiobacteraeota bacterium]